MDSTRIKSIETLVDAYVACWLPNRKQYGGIYEDNDFGCERLQLCRHGFVPEKLSHKELSQVSYLLTRQLRGQINRDHKLFWAWCGEMASHFSQSNSNSKLLSDSTWQHAFGDLIHLSLVGLKNRQAGPAHLKAQQIALQSVNFHLLETEMAKHQLGLSFAYAVLEGELRRNNHPHVAVDGRVLTNFAIRDHNMRQVKYSQGQ